MHVNQFNSIYWSLNAWCCAGNKTFTSIIFLSYWLVMMCYLCNFVVVMPTEHLLLLYLGRGGYWWCVPLLWWIVNTCVVEWNIQHVLANLFLCSKINLVLQHINNWWFLTFNCEYLWHISTNNCFKITKQTNQFT